MTSPIVSVVLTTFNRARLVGGAIDSIRGQTFADWELIVVDDGSTDDTPAVLHAASEADSRIQIVRQSNAGVARALNAGIERARGEFVAFQDDDDFSHPSRLRELTAVMRDNSAAQMAAAMTQPFADIDNKTVGRPIFDFKRDLFRRVILREAGNFRPFFRICEDTDLQLRIEERDFSCARVKAILYFMRIGDHSHLCSDNEAVLYRFAMLVSARCRRLGLPDPVADGKPFDDVLTECRAVDGVFRDKKMSAQVIRGHRAQIHERLKSGDKNRAAQIRRDAREAMRRCGYSEAVTRAALARMRRSLWAIAAREWGRRLRGEAPRRVPIAEYIRPADGDFGETNKARQCEANLPSSA